MRFTTVVPRPTAAAGTQDTVSSLDHLTSSLVTAYAYGKYEVHNGRSSAYGKYEVHNVRFSGIHSLLSLSTGSSWVRRPPVSRDKTARFTLKGSSGPLVVPLGGSVVLPCSVDSLLPLKDLEVEWRRSDSQTLIHLYQDEDIRPEAQHQDYHDRAHFFTEDIKHGNFSLLLNNLTAEDEGQYTCKVYSGQESGETVVEIKHVERLIVSGSSQSISASVGGDVTLSCSVNSHIKPEEIEEVSWKKIDKDEEIPVLLYQYNETLSDASDERYRDRVEFFTDEIHRGNFSLRLKRVRTEDKGVYICQVINGRLSANTIVKLERLGFSGLQIMVLILCTTACGFAILFCSLIYCRPNNQE
ncbi:junctional adhesion molecule-like [Misgurnus anguillicaudatus]|uniref:junctional adhesion molecule-like n=1 Tax=Misgurnus anguillicaudatus TaxID=75329 RepID=UPI003CCF2A2F